MVPMSTVTTPPLADQLRSVVPPEMQSLLTELTARLERLERTLRSFAEHGATYGWIPDDAHRWDTADWFEYMHRVDRTVSQRAAGALGD